MAEAGRLTVLNLGCGRKTDPAWYHIVTQPADLAITFINLDALPTVGAGLVCTLGRDRIDLPDDSVDLVIAIHVLEHVGRQGDLGEWFQMWAELYRILTPGGRVQFECPHYTSVWAWADPTHTRAISRYSFLYHNQDAYRDRDSAIPDYRPPFDFLLTNWELGRDGNAEVVATEGETSICRGTLVARKPLRSYWEYPSCETKSSG